MKIITAELIHLEELTQLFDAYRQFYRQETDLAAARAFLSERIQQKESIIFLAIDGENACGFVQLYPIFTSVGMKRSWLLNDLFVAPEYRQAGVAQALIERAKALSRSTNAAGLLLETEKNNVQGNQLYLKTNFKLYNANNFYFWQNDSI